MEYNYTVRVALLDHKFGGREAINELTDFLADNLKNQYQVNPTCYSHAGNPIWHCNVIVDTKEDVARLMLLRDCTLISRNEI